MGNQGAKNWKLTALFAISLMLIAGLFTDVRRNRKRRFRNSICERGRLQLMKVGLVLPQAAVFRGNNSFMSIKR